jgi:hypothetical protein
MLLYHKEEDFLFDKEIRSDIINFDPKENICKLQYL